MKIKLDKDEKHSVQVNVVSTTTGGDLNTHTLNAGDKEYTVDIPDEARVVITRGAPTPEAEPADAVEKEK